MYIHTYLYVPVIITYYFHCSHYLLAFFKNNFNDGGPSIVLWGKKIVNMHYLKLACRSQTFTRGDA